MRILILFVMLSLSGCGIENNTNSTEVSISLGQSHVASGAIGASGSIPANIQSVSVEALNPAGKVVAGPIIANRPNFIIKIRVPNGNGIRFRILAYSQASATGVVLYETLSAPVNLQGKPVAVPVKMNLSVKVTADKSSTFRGGLVNLIGKVSGNTPNVASPLLWNNTGGTLNVLDVYGTAATWTAPNTIGKFTVAAHIDPDVNSDQDPNVKGAVQINVINRDPYVAESFGNSSISIQASTGPTFFPFTIIADLDGDTLQALAPSKPTWVNLVATGSNPLSLDLELNPLADISGTFTFTVGVSDGFAGNVTQVVTITVTPAPTATLAPVITTSFPPTIGDTTPTIFGDAPFGSVIDVYADGLFVGQTPTFDGAEAGPPQGRFNYAFTTPLSEATHTFTAYATLSGVRSGVSNSVSVTILVPPAPSITTNNTLSLANNTPVPTTITTSLLETTDPDTGPTGLLYTITTLPTQGSLSATSFITQATINSGLFQYTPNAGASGVDSFVFEVTDGTSVRNGVFYISYNFGAAKTIISATNGNNIMATGSVSCNTVWDAYGSPYVVQNGVLVEVSCQLVIEAGVIIKADTGNSLLVKSGATLHIRGNTDQPVTFTSIHDDSVGGDTNANGVVTTPAMREGLSLIYRAGSFGNISFLKTSYADSFTISAPITMNDVTRFNGGFAMAFFGTMNQTISNLHIEHFGIGGTSGLTISGPETNPLFIGNNTFDKYTGIHEGILISGGANPNFSNFVVDMHGANDPALIISGASTTGLFLNNTFQNSAEGIRIDSGASPIISKNIIRNNSSGIYFSQWFNPNNTKAGDVVLKNNKFVNNGNGLFIKNTTSALLENNLIRGNANAGIRVDTLNKTIGAIQVRNNLIVENFTGIYVVGDANPATDTYAIIQNNTVSGNIGSGLFLDTYTNVTADYNIFAINSSADVASQSNSLTSSFNLTTDDSLPSTGTTDIFADPQFGAGFYISDGSGLNGNISLAASLAIDPVGLIALASSQPFIITNPYAQPNIVDSGVLDLGYHHATPAPFISSANTVITSTVLAGGFSTTDIKITIIPKDSLGNTIGAGLVISVDDISLKGFANNAIDLGNGTYEVTYSTFLPSPDIANLSIAINDTTINYNAPW